MGQGTLQNELAFIPHQNQRFGGGILLFLGKGYGALEEFARRHHQALVERLSIPSNRLPSDSTFRRITINIDFEDLGRVFNQWARDYVSLEQSEWLAIDGKSIKCTVINYDNADQNFVSVVSVFSTAQGLTISLSQFKHKENSEITVLQARLEALDLSHVVFTFDALQLSKKTVELIVEGGNDYVIAVKANQTNLY